MNTYKERNASDILSNVLCKCLFTACAHILYLSSPESSTCFGLEQCGVFEVDLKKVFDLNLSCIVDDVLVV